MPIEFAAPGTVLELQSEVEARIVIHGEGNTLRVGKNVVLKAAIWLQGTGGLVEIGDGCHIDGLIRTVRGHGGVIRIGRGTSINAAGLSMHEAAEINIGEDCMFSTDIHMDVSDMHPIYDRATGRRINPARNIDIGDHVWLGTRVLVNKGASIGAGTVVGAGSMVVGALPANVIALGTPAKVVRENVEWRRDFGDVVELRGTAAGGRGWLDRLKGLRQKAP